MTLLFQSQVWGVLCRAAGQGWGSAAQHHGTDQWVQVLLLLAACLSCQAAMQQWWCFFPPITRTEERRHLCSGDHRRRLQDSSHQRENQQIFRKGAEHDVELGRGCGQRMCTAGWFLDMNFLMANANILESRVAHGWYKHCEKCFSYLDFFCLVFSQNIKKNLNQEVKTIVLF